ncbi:MAG: shikimate dehydrogenase [Bacteroidetes bacterium]|nr:shikimate dehydrogenase [Bacteroidota bacterium]
MRKFGLIGYPLSHSFSQKYFSEKFRKENITDCVYENFSFPSIDVLPGLISSQPDLVGLNVTIPYKQQVIPFLDYSNDVVQRIAACNCIHIRNGKLFGYNTDVFGFEQSLKKNLQPYHTKALILGTGGAAKAVEYVLEKNGISYKIVSRNPLVHSKKHIGYDQVSPSLINEYYLIINTTPLGMYPNVEQCPPLPYDSLSPRHYLFDLIYNPDKTLFLRKGAEKGAVIQNGAQMLVVQAEESWKIWNEVNS